MCYKVMIYGPTSSAGAIAISGRLSKSELLRYPTLYQTLSYEFVQTQFKPTTYLSPKPSSKYWTYLSLSHAIHLDRATLDAMAEFQGGDRDTADHAWRDPI